MSQGLTHYHTKIKQYISDFVRNAMLQAGNAFLITYNGTAGDKTQLEIYAAINSGKVCLLYDSNWNQYAYGGQIGSGNTVYFCTTRPGSEGLVCTEYSVTSSNEWARRQVLNPGEAPIDNEIYGRWNGSWEKISVSPSIVQGTVTSGVGQAQLYAMTDFGSLNLSGGVLTINFGSPLSGVLAEGAAEFSLTADNSVGSLVVTLSGNACPVINAPDAGSWKAGKCYQVTMVDGYCVVGEFPIRTWGFADIGGRTYKTVTIGTQTWMAENLDYKFEGCGFGSSTATDYTPQCMYYVINDEETYGHDGTIPCGLLYNKPSVDVLNSNRATLCPGWHVPSNAEWETLVAYVGGESVAGTKLKKSGDPIWGSYTWNGTDDFGFGALPCGSCQGIGNASHLGQKTLFRNSGGKMVSIETGAGIQLDKDWANYYKCSVRLVKDA